MCVVRLTNESDAMVFNGIYATKNDFITPYHSVYIFV